MIRLDTTTRKLQAVLAGAITTNQLPCMVSYSDKTTTTYNGGTQLQNTNNTTQVDICSAPAASTIRDIDYVNIRNRDTAAATVTVIFDDNSTDYELQKAVLAVGDQLVYTHGSGWQVLDSTGALKTTSGGSSVTAATQAEQEAGSSTSVYTSPGRQQYHPSAVKAWVNFDGTAGTISPRASYNVSSITDNGTGDYTMNLTTSFSSANYSWAGNGGDQSVTLGTLMVSDTTPTASAFRFLTVSNTGTGQDSAWVSVHLTGDQ